MTVCDCSQTCAMCAEVCVLLGGCSFVLYLCFLLTFHHCSCSLLCCSNLEGTGLGAEVYLSSCTNRTSFRLVPAQLVVER